VVAVGLAEDPQRKPVADAEDDLGDRLRLAVEGQHALLLLGGEDRGDLLARAAHELGVLGGDLRVAAREREQLERQRQELGVLAQHRLERAPQHGDEVLGARGAGQLLVEHAEPQLGVAPDHLGQQPLLGAEVVVQQPARDARVARDVVERRARDAAQGDRGAHRVDDPLRLLAAELGPLGGRLHEAILAGRPTGHPKKKGAPSGAPFARLLVGAGGYAYAADPAVGAADGAVVEV
jgi:hypothetical protein